MRCHKCLNENKNLGSNKTYNCTNCNIIIDRDINSAIKVTNNMDASNMLGNQLGINLNSTTIKLTGYNNF